MDKIEIRQKKGSEKQIMGGRNTEVLINGKILTGVMSAKFEIDGKSIGRVILELVGNISIEGNFNTEENNER